MRQKMKYQKIYDVLHRHPKLHVNDQSYWHSGQSGYIAAIRPLTLIIEAPEAGLRIWVNHENGKYSISAADMTFSCNSCEYHQSFRRYPCRNQTETAEKLEGLLLKKRGDNHAAI